MSAGASTIASGSCSSTTAPKELSLDELLRGFRPMMQRLVGERVAIDIVAGTTPRIVADPGQLEQVLMNLAVNARDAMDGVGRLTIETSSQRVDEEDARTLGLSPGPHVTIAITDTGGGMSAEVQQRIFEPFFTTKDIGHGTGLGLSIVHGIIHQAHGAISVYSQPGHGTTFRIFLPVPDSVSAPATTTAIPIVHTATELPSLTVLVVDESPELRTAAARVLRDAGCTPILCASAAAARAACVSHDGNIDAAISESYSGTIYNTYELFWDEADRLIATQIGFAAARPFPTASPCTYAGGCITYSGVRWSYHYLGSTVIGATREKVHVDGTVFEDLFWFLTDERGLVHRVVDDDAQTWWQANWDANGVRTMIGTAQPEMWIPFGLPGQVVLGDTQFEAWNGFGTRLSGSEATIRPSSISTSSSSSEAFAYESWNAVDKSVSTRWSSAFADNQWIMLDLGMVKPLSGVRLTWETAYGDGYRIEVANGPNGPWTTMYSTTTGDGFVDEISFNANARYVRMFGTHRATPWGFSLWEFEVFGPWTRPSISLNQWRPYDPLSQGFLQSDSVDVLSRLEPEGYSISRANPLRFSDPNGTESIDNLAYGRSLFGGGTWDASCTGDDKNVLLTEIGRAISAIGKCTAGICRYKNTERHVRYAIMRGTYECNKTRIHPGTGIPILMSTEGAFLFPGEPDAAAYTDLNVAWMNFSVNRGLKYSPGDCLAKTIVHEATHVTLLTLPDWLPWVAGLTPKHVFRGRWPWRTWADARVWLMRKNNPGAKEFSATELHEQDVRNLTEECKICD